MPVSIAVFFGIMLGFQLGLMRGGRERKPAPPPPPVETESCLPVDAMPGVPAQGGGFADACPKGR